MAEMKKSIQNRLDVICDQFITEKIGENEIKLMPPKDKIPIISRFFYEKSDDAFEIYFNECNDYVCKTKNGIEFLEDKSGNLMVIRILNFSQLEVERIKLAVLTSIENEIEHVTMELKQKKNILKNVVDKRKLMFLDDMVKNEYKELRKEFLT